MSGFTGKNILDALEASGFATCWEWTGGNCRAACIFRDRTMTGSCVRITHGWDPFSDDDLNRDISGELAIAHYLHQDPEEPAVQIIEATGTADIVTAVTALLPPRLPQVAKMW